MNLLGIGRKLIDPRTYDKGVNQEKKVRALKWWEDDTTAPTVPEVKSIEEYVQKNRQVPVVSSIVDRSKTDSLITNINDIELSRPVWIQGGTNFMFKYPDSLFANQEAIARRHLNTAKTLEEQFGVPPLFAPNLMSPSGSDFMTGSAELAMSHAFETLDAASKRELDDFIRKKGFDVTKKRKLANGKEESYIKNYKLENWHGIDDPRSIDQLRNAPADLRKEIVKKFGTKNYFGPEGFLAPGEIRTMITQDDLMNARDSRFTNIGVFNTAEGLKPSNHWSYSHMFPGQGDARLIEAGNIGIYDFDTILKAGKGGKIVPFTKSDGTLRKPKDPRNPSSKDLTAVGKNITIGILDEAQLEKWKDLGIVGVPALTLAALGSSSLASEPKLPEFLDRINNPQDHPYIINPDGSISTHRMAAEQSSSGNWYVFPTIQKMPDGTLKEFLLPDGTPDNYNAMKYAIATNNILQMKDKDSAIAYAEGSYKTGTPLESFDPMKLQSEDYMNARLNNNYAEVREAPRGPISGMLADAFMGAKEYLNEMPNVAEFFREAFGRGFGAEIAGAQGRAPTSENVNVPLGDIMLGETPEAINQLSYGLTPNAEQGLDLALTAGGGLTGAAKGLMKAGKSLGPKFLEMSEDFARKTGTLLDAAPPGPRGPEMAPRSDLGFYSEVEQTAMNIKRNKGSGQDFLNEIRNTKGVKEDEIRWMGLDEFLEGKDKVTKQDVVDYIGRQKLNVDEVVLGSPSKPFIDKVMNSESLRFLKGYPEASKIIREKISQYNHRGSVNERTFFSRLREDILNSDAEYEILKAAAEDAGYKYNIDDYLDSITTDLYFSGGARNYQTPADFVISNFAKDVHNRIFSNPDGPRLEYFEGPIWAGNPTLNLPKGENGREILLRYPITDPWDTFSHEGHWQDYGIETNIFAHLRVNDRTDADGKKMLFIEELQSDWHQQGKEFGYQNVEGVDKDGFEVPYVPNAPMKNTWHETALRRAIRFAAENGYERIGITPSKVQIARNPSAGEAGMKLNYDQKYPKYLSKYGKKWGARSGKTSIDVGAKWRPSDPSYPYPAKADQLEIFYLDITPEMREGVMKKGQPLFSAAPFVGSGLLADDKQDQNNSRSLN